MKIKFKLLIGFLSVSMIILVAGILGIVEIKTLYSVSKEVGMKNAPLADAAMEIKLTATTAHLWFEEIIAGAENKEVIEEVWQLLDESLWYVDAMVKGGKNAEGTFYAVNDRVIESKLLSVKTDIEAFRKIAQLRFDNIFGNQKLQDQTLDDKFDAVFDKFITSADEVEEMLHDKIAQDAEIMENTALNGMLILGIATLLGFLMATVAAYFISHDIIKQVGGEPAEIAHITEQIAAGHFELQLESEKVATGIYAAVQVMVKNLQTLNSERDKQTWLKTGQTQLNDLLSGEQNLTTLAKNTISYLTTYAQAQVGLFYLYQKAQENKKESLQMIASYAYTANDRPTQFQIGEGLVGQTALEQKTLLITQTPEEGYSIIRSGLTNALPHSVLLLPCLYENTIKAVIEIGFSQTITETQRNFLEQIMPNIGIAINTAQSRMKMQTLLEQSQQQSEELQVQSEELKAQQEEMQQVNEELQTQREQLQNKQEELQHHNEELQSQAEEMQSQAEELQTQQEELRQTNEALEERTRELEQQKAGMQQKNLALEQTQIEMQKTQTALETKANELELASRYKSEFLANMSHELRTPLNSLLILAQLLANNQAGNLTDKQVEYAKTIHSAGADLLALINDILDLSKVEAGKIEIHANDILLTDLLETIEQKFRPIAEEKGLNFQITIAEELPTHLYTDEQRLKQILNNLLSNAFKFTQQGDIKLIVQKSKTDFISFSVSDTGIGIPEEKQKMIFEAFQQADGSTQRRYGGTGLGLSISRQFARLLGGEITLHSEEDKGSTFTFSLPEKLNKNTKIQNTKFSEPLSDIKPSPQLPDIILPSESTTPSLNETEFTDETIEPIKDDRENLKPEDKSLLIIDDDRQFSQLILELARETGFKCLLAYEGRMGLELAEQYQPNAIILDIGLPCINGWTVMEHLKDNPNTRHIPVHFISAFEQHLEAQKMGAIGYLNKPVSLEQLGETFQKIEQFLKQTVKNLLVIADSEAHQQKIMALLNNKDVNITLAVTRVNALQHLQKIAFDCIILDMDIEQQSGIQLLEQMQQESGLCQIPVITYTERELTSEEEALLLQCADKLPIKSVNSPERLLDEATLFLHQVEADLPKEQRNLLRMVHDKEMILAQKKVLIVDDDMRNIFALATVLEDKNMEVLSADNGHEALELLAEHADIALILMDIMMPEMDGYEAMRQIRNSPNFRKLPIIALTAKAMKGDKAKCIEAGANDYLSKPVDTDKLISLMRVWLYR
jgi:signal transduction histidine kinase/CheY-like chemotaxis protein